RGVVTDLRIAHQVCTIVRQAVEIAILAGGDRERLAALQCEDRRDGPVAREAARKRSRLLQVVHLPDAGQRQAVRAIVGVTPAFPGQGGRIWAPRKTAALEVDVFVPSTEGVVRLAREARATPLGAQLQPVVVAA